MRQTFHIKIESKSNTNKSTLTAEVIKVDIFGHTTFIIKDTASNESGKTLTRAAKEAVQEIAKQEPSILNKDTFILAVDSLGYCDVLNFEDGSAIFSALKGYDKNRHKGDTDSIIGLACRVLLKARLPKSDAIH